MQCFKSSHSTQYFAGFFLCLAMRDLREEACLGIYFWKSDFARSLTSRSDPSKHVPSCPRPRASRGFCQTSSAVALFCQHRLGLVDSPQKTKARHFQSILCCCQSCQRGEAKFSLVFWIHLFMLWVFFCHIFPFFFYFFFLFFSSKSVA